MKSQGGYFICLAEDRSSGIGHYFVDAGQSCCSTVLCNCQSKCCDTCDEMSSSPSKVAEHRVLVQDTGPGSDPCNAHLLAWRSWRLKRVAISSLSAECQALLVGANMSMWLQEAIYFAYGVRLPIDLRTDCKSLVENLATTHSVEDVRVSVQLQDLKSDLEDGIYRSIRHICGITNPADGLTKKPNAVVLDRIRKIMGDNTLSDVH